MMQFLKRLQASTNCSHSYCQSQSIDHGPDFNVQVSGASLNCETASEDFHKGRYIDRHFFKDRGTALYLEVSQNHDNIFNIILEPRDIQDLVGSRLLELNNLCVTLCVTEIDHALEKIALLETYSNIHFYFSMSKNKIEPSDIEKLKSRFPRLNFQPVLTGQIFNFEWSDFNDRSPTVEKTIDKRANERPLVSIILPVFDHARELQLTLKQLAKQSLASTKFELIVIEDGSNELAEDTAKEFLSSHTNLNVYYTNLTRPAKREMGDNGWRSMVARNFGVTRSRGEILLFLDADILLDRNFIEKLILKHKDFDVIQPCRYHLTKEETESLYANPQHLEGSFSKLERETWSRSNNYFEAFQSETSDWNKIDFGWRYASTFCFSVKKEKFLSFGGFSKSYCFYGFDDVELGYRMFCRGEKFYLLKENVYALFHEEKRSEYQDDKEKKRALHSSSAKLFYFQNLDSDIFKVLEPYYVEGQ